MVAKFYLHTAATGDTGTLPASNASVSATAPNTTPSLTNKSMDATVGTTQTSNAITTLANTSAQSTVIGRWLSAPIAAQTIAAQNIFVDFGASESSTNSNFHTRVTVCVWRPGTGAVVGRMEDLATGEGGSVPGTTEGASAHNIPSSTAVAVTSQDGDILVLEIRRDTTAQGMATAYTNTVFYDGTTDDSITSNAAFLQFTNDVAMSTGAAHSLVSDSRRIRRNSLLVR